MGENIIVYEYASRGSLDKYLKDDGLTWMKRLQICIDIASGLDFLHAGGPTQEVVIHRDMKTHNILLNDDWKAKISDLGLSMIRTLDKEKDHASEVPAGGTFGYCDPQYIRSGVLTKEVDIYAFGAILIEILSGRVVFELMSGDWRKDPFQLFRRHFREGDVGEMVFEAIKEQVAPKSLTTYAKIAHQCLHHVREERPATGEVLRQLREALDSSQVRAQILTNLSSVLINERQI